MTNLKSATGEWVIDPSHSYIGFQARHLVVAKVRGKFTDFEGRFILDGENPSQSTAQIIIKTDSVATDSDGRDTHLKSAEFFDVEKFGTIEFSSTKVVQESGNEFAVTGDLTIKGITKSITVNFEYLGTQVDPWGAKKIAFEGSGEVDRNDFGLTWNVALEAGGVLVGDKIKLVIDIEAVAAG